MALDYTLRDQSTIYAWSNFTAILKGLEKGHRVDYTVCNSRTSEDTVSKESLSFGTIDTKTGKKNQRKDTLIKIKDYLESHPHLLHVRATSEDSERFKEQLDKVIDTRISDLQSRKNRWFIRKAHVKIIDQRIAELTAIKAVQYSIDRGPYSFIGMHREIQGEIQMAENISASSVSNSFPTTPLPTPLKKSSSTSFNPLTPSFTSPIPAPPQALSFNSPLSPPPLIGEKRAIKKEILFAGQKSHHEFMSQLTDKVDPIKESELKNYLEKLEEIKKMYAEWMALTHDLQKNQKFLLEQAEEDAKKREQLVLLEEAQKQQRSLNIIHRVNNEEYLLMLLSAPDMALLQEKCSHSTLDLKNLSLDHQIKELKKFIAKFSETTESTEATCQTLSIKIEALTKTQPLFKSLSEEELNKAIKDLNENMRRYNYSRNSRNSSRTLPKLPRTPSMLSVRSPVGSPSQKGSSFDQLVEQVKNAPITLAIALQNGSTEITHKLMIL